MRKLAEGAAADASFKVQGSRLQGHPGALARLQEELAGTGQRGGCRARRVRPALASRFAAARRRRTRGRLASGRPECQIRRRDRGDSDSQTSSQASRFLILDRDTCELAPRTENPRTRETFDVPRISALGAFPREALCCDEWKNHPGATSGDRGGQPSRFQVDYFRQPAPQSSPGSAASKADAQGDGSKPGWRAARFSTARLPGYPVRNEGAGRERREGRRRSRRRR